MKSKILYNGFLDALRKKVPQNAVLANQLAEILTIEKEAVYRRLRGEVPFTFFEIAAISRELNISLDGLIGIGSTITRSFQLRLMEYVQPSEEHIRTLDTLAELVVRSQELPESEIAYAGNMLPSPLFLAYENLTRFYHFKWLYQYGRETDVKPLAQVHISAEMDEVYRKFIRGTRQIRTTYYILDYMIFQYLINDIRYFESIRLITRPEVEQLRVDILRLLDDLERIAAKGEYLKNEHPVYVYISHINLATNYCYFETPEVTLSMIKVFTLNEIVSEDDESFGKIKTWVRSLKRLSTMISVSGERSRIEFFDKQRERIGQL